MKGEKCRIVVINFFLYSSFLSGQDINLDSAYLNNNPELIENFLESGSVKDIGNVIENDTIVVAAKLFYEFISGQALNYSELKYWISGSEVLKVLVVDTIGISQKCYEKHSKKAGNLEVSPPHPHCPYYGYKDYLPNSLNKYDVNIAYIVANYLPKIPITISEKMHQELELFFGSYYPRDSSSFQVPLRTRDEVLKRIELFRKYICVKTEGGLYYEFSSGIGISYIILNKKLDKAQIGYWEPWSSGMAILERPKGKWEVVFKKCLYVE